jgi:hypothetical protein
MEQKPRQAWMSLYMVQQTRQQARDHIKWGLLLPNNALQQTTNVLSRLGHNRQKNLLPTAKVTKQTRLADSYRSGNGSRGELIHPVLHQESKTRSHNLLPTACHCQPLPSVLSNDNLLEETCPIVRVPEAA